MWSALAQIGISLGIAEASKLIQGALLDPAKLNDIANRILRAASSRGSEMLNKAMNAINNIPQLAGSASVQQYLRNARAKARENYSNVEKQVNEMNQDAQNLANNISSTADRKSWIEQAFHKDSIMKEAENKADAFINKIGGIENAVQK